MNNIVATAEAALEPATPLGFFELIFGTLFEPRRCFHALAYHTGLVRQRWILTIVLLLGAAQALTQPDVAALTLLGLSLNMLQHGLGALAFWLLLSGLMGALALLTRPKIRFWPLANLVALSMLPWIFMGPLQLLQRLPYELASVTAVIGKVFLWLWSSWLLALALKNVYELNWLQAGLWFLVIPVGGLASLVATIGFFVTASRLGH